MTSRSIFNYSHKIAYEFNEQMNIYRKIELQNFINICMPLKLHQHIIVHRFRVDKIQ